MTYRPPIEDIVHSLNTAAGLPDLIARGVLEGVDQALLASVLEEAGRFAAEAIAPLNRVGDLAHSQLIDGRVRVPDGWTETYHRWREAGWNALSGPSEFGGQGLPQTIGMAVSELWSSACLSFGLGPTLTFGAVDALHMVANDELKRTYLPKMVSGQWMGTMNLTEPHAGTDLGALKTRAVPQADGSYRITGTKIFISYGDHEMTENIIHLVLARLPNAPAGTRGISLFLVPKYLLNPDGSIGRRNDLRCARLENKLGIHASPTCEMRYGENEGAIGWLVGEENRGLNHMFIMMNRARLGVGIQGVAIAERATQQALAYASERKQGRTAGMSADAMVPIAEHPDVRRNLLMMRALTMAARAICYATARELDLSERASDRNERARAASRVALLTPVAKAFATDIGVEVASTGLQVHGGMGFIEDAGAAQHYRDARILPIYEGTNGVQAIDLVTRKLPLEGGKAIEGYIGELQATALAVRSSTQPLLAGIAPLLEGANAALERATRFLGRALQSGETDVALAGATPYLRLFGLVAGATYLARGAAAEVEASTHRAGHHVQLACVFARQMLPAADGLATTVVEGAQSVLAADPSLTRA
jgi:alkylation response protein AidB-like acyl-CoA dehydrogenase